MVRWLPGELRDARGWRPWLLVVPAAAVALAVVGWALARGDALDAVRRRGVIRIGYAVEAPFAYVAADGRVTGESPETARLVAARLGCRTEWIQTDFSALIPDLLDHRFDMVAAGMFQTPQRARLVRFAAPGLRVRPGLLIAKGNPVSVRAYADFKAVPALRVAVLAGSVEQERLRGLDTAQLVTVPDARAGATAVETGVADALALSLPTVRAMARGRPGLEARAAEDLDGTASVAAAFRPEDEDLLAAWNRAQAQVLGTPAHLQAIAPFGFEAADVPPPQGRAP